MVIGCVYECVCDAMACKHIYSYYYTFWMNFILDQWMHLIEYTSTSVKIKSQLRATEVKSAKSKYKRFIKFMWAQHSARSENSVNTNIPDVTLEWTSYFARQYTCPAKKKTVIRGQQKVSLLKTLTVNNDTKQVIFCTIESSYCIKWKRKQVKFFPYNLNRYNYCLQSITWWRLPQRILYTCLHVIVRRKTKGVGKEDEMTPLNWFLAKSEC